jgi:flavin reductase (DIM6/NTAB) family NADH-FMN oxidoreductase RutF
MLNEGVDTTLFKRAASHLASGVSVITTCDHDGKRWGLTMSAVMSLSLDPMQFLISIDRRSNSLAAIMETGKFCINFLSANQQSISNLFASKTAKDFAQVPHHLGKTGLPIINDAVASVTCDIARSLDGGDHQILIGNVVDIVISGGDPLVYFNGGYARLMID